MPEHAASSEPVPPSLSVLSQLPSSVTWLAVQDVIATLHGALNTEWSVQLGLPVQ